MGSKRVMLQNGLGTIISQQFDGKKPSRFVDLFAGSSAVAAHVAEQFDIPVIAFDLQKYSVALANAVLRRDGKIKATEIWPIWHIEAKKHFELISPPIAYVLTQEIVENFRKWSAAQEGLPITKAYGGHYFSPSQAVWIDVLRATLPTNKEIINVALAALIQAASLCVAAPGHTAQPFQPTRTAKRFLQEAWHRDIVAKTKAAFEDLASRHAKQRGTARVADANKAASGLQKGDLVFIDPPYSGVHYSRFYHVLETIARGTCGEVSGRGRYPAAEERPSSKYSMRSESEDALEDLLEKISKQGARAILTFPAHECSNGLSGRVVRETAAKYFTIVEDRVKSRFSTLGGTGSKKKKQKEARRAARQHAAELMLVLEPK
jgi:adenine-specific DNA methylase